MKLLFKVARFDGGEHTRTIISGSDQLRQAFKEKKFQYASCYKISAESHLPSKARRGWGEAGFLYPAS